MKVRARSGLRWLPLLPLAVSVGLGTACKGDTATQMHTIPPPTLQQVVLSPAAATVVAGATQQFVTAGRMSDGSSAAVTVTYAATGGTISSDGLYTAGTAAGTYRVIATLSGGSLADSADVTVTPSGGGGGGGAHTYSTAFPLSENPISENGHWIDGGLVGLDWTNVSTTPGLAIGHQIAASFTDATAILTGTWGPDQMATATVHTVNQKDACYQEVELRLRSALVAHLSTGYEISFKASQSSAAYLIIVRWNGLLGDFTYLLNTTGSQFAIKDGDVVSAKVVGHVITAYRNGVQMGQATDSVFNSGNPGMGFNLENLPVGCFGTNGDYGFTHYAATDSVPH